MSKPKYNPTIMIPYGSKDAKDTDAEENDSKTTLKQYLTVHIVPHSSGLDFLEEMKQEFEKS